MKPGSESEVGGAVILEKMLYRSSKVAVVVHHFIAYSDGAEFSIKLFRGPETGEREWLRAVHEHTMFWGEPEPDALEVRLVGDDGLEWELESRGGGGGENRWDVNASYLDDLSGEKVELAVSWPKLGLDKAVLPLPVAQLREAASRVVRLWD